MRVHESDLWDILRTVDDPELPISIVDLGIVHRAEVHGAAAEVELMPTFSGCPALELIRQRVVTRLAAEGISSARVSWTYAIRWGPERISPSGQARLREFGILANSDPSTADRTAQGCPYCQSTQTERMSAFGPALCRALYYCRACQTSFEQLKRPGLPTVFERV